MCAVPLAMLCCEPNCDDPIQFFKQAVTHLKQAVTHHGPAPAGQTANGTAAAIPLLLLM